jgi:hypothetical protein
VADGKGDNERVPRWAVAALLEGASGAALALGVVGVVRTGTDRWLGVALILLSVVFGVASVARQRKRELGAWASIVSVLVVGALGCAFVVVRDAAKISRDYASAYDDTDPGNCAEGAGVAVEVPGGRVELLGERHEAIGSLQLIRSTRCATIWAHVTLTSSAARQLKGRTLEIVVVRPADEERAPYPLPLKGGQEGYGNQLGATACIEGQAWLLPGEDHPRGPVVHTPCR